MQSLWDTEVKYSGEDGEHEYETWEGRLSNAEVYDDEDLDNHEEAWSSVAYNAGETDIPGVHTDDETGWRNLAGEEGEVFPGGMHGICEDGLTWQYDDDIGVERWECSGDFGWDQLVNLPETDGSFAALMIPYTNFMESVELDEEGFENTDFATYPVGLGAAGMDDEWGEPQELVDVTCWDGGLADRDEAENTISMDAGQEVTVDPDSDAPGIVVYGELEHDERYSCSWEYETDGNEFTELRGIGEVIEMHADSQPTDALENVVSEQFSAVEGFKAEYSSMSDFENEASDFELVQIS